MSICSLPARWEARNGLTCDKFNEAQSTRCFSSGRQHQGLQKHSELPGKVEGLLSFIDRG
jgi:hypothetical protein